MENNWYDMYLNWLNGEPDLPPMSEPPPTTAPFPTATPGGTPFGGTPLNYNPFSPGTPAVPLVTGETPPSGPGPQVIIPRGNASPPFAGNPSGAGLPGDPFSNPVGAGIADPTLPDTGTRTVGSGAVPQDDSGQVPGVDLSLRDRVNQMLHNMGLPPLPADYSPTGGLPPGFADLTRGENLEHNTGFNNGAPVYTNTTGPQWNGGSIFGGTFGNRGGFTPGSFAPIAGEASMLPSTWQMAMSRGIWGGRRPFTEQNFNNWQGFMNYQGNALQGAKFAKGYGPQNSSGMSYQDYLNTWNQLRSSGRTTGLGTLGMSPAAQINAGAGTSAHGNRPFAAAEGGVVPDDEPSDFYASIGRPVYGAMRKGEDVSKNVFHALGELGKYLQGPLPNANSAGMIPTSPASRPAPRSSGMPPSADALIEWLMKPSDGVVPLPGYRERTGPFRMEQEPPTTGRFLPMLYDARSGGGRLAQFLPAPDYSDQFRPDSYPLGKQLSPSRFMPSIYDERASGALMASKGRVVPSMGVSSHGMRGIGMASHGMPSMGMRSGMTDTVPAMLTPGEVVLNEEQQKAVMPVPGREQMLRRDQRAKLAQSWLT